MTTTIDRSDAVNLLRATWSRFTDVYNELLELALARDDADDGALVALLNSLLGNIQYSALQLHGDPEHPTLINAQYLPWNWGHSNPDTLYLACRVDDQNEYRVFGRLGTVAKTTFGMYTGTTDQSSAVKVLAEDLEVDDDGSFEIFFTRERRGPNWFPMPHGAKTFGSYQTYENWDQQVKGVVRIECLAPHSPGQPKQLGQVIDAFNEQLEAARILFRMWVQDIPDRVFGSVPVNTALPPIQPPSAMAGTWFSSISWQLDDGEGLVIDYTLPDDCSYSGICLTNRWSQMFDLETRQTSLNLAQSLVDGRQVRVLVAMEDVGVHNWLDARGYHSGIAMWRASSTFAPPAPNVTKIRLDDLDDYFGGTPRVSPDERASALAGRLRHFADRNTL